MKLVESDGEWALFCPNEAPGLSDTYGEDFEKLYHKYLEEGRERETIKARQLWNAILEAQVETGTPYMLYKVRNNPLTPPKFLSGRMQFEIESEESWGDKMQQFVHGDR